MKEMSEQEMLHRMAAYCTASERCIQEVEKKIAAAGLPQEASDRILKRLIEERFIDEKRYARFFVNDKLKFNKWGKMKIAYELLKRGIPSELRREALEQIDPEEYHDLLFKLLKDKKKTVRSKDKRDLYAKLLRFAAGRGFEGGETNDCLRQLLRNDDPE